jgi:hypothetical protein
MSIPNKALLCSAADDDDDDDEGSLGEIFATAKQDFNDEDDSFVDLYAVIEGRARAKPSTSSLNDSKGRKDPEAQPRRNKISPIRRQVTRSHSPSGPPLRRREDARSSSPKPTSNRPESSHTLSDGPKKMSSSSGTRGTKSMNGSNAFSLNGSNSSRSSAASPIPSPKPVRQMNDGDSNDLNILFRNVSVNSLQRRNDSSDRICRSMKGRAESSLEAGRANTSANSLSSRSRRDASPHFHGGANESFDLPTLKRHVSMDSQRQKGNIDPHLFPTALKRHASIDQVHQVRIEKLHRSDHNRTDHNRTDHNRMERLSERPSDHDRRRVSAVRSMSPAGSGTTSMLVAASSKSLSPNTTRQPCSSLPKSFSPIRDAANEETGKFVTGKVNSITRKLSSDNISSRKLPEPNKELASSDLRRQKDGSMLKEKSKKKYMDNLFK